MAIFLCCSRQYNAYDVHNVGYHCKCERSGEIKSFIRWITAIIMNCFISYFTLDDVLLK